MALNGSSGYRPFTTSTEPIIPASSEIETSPLLVISPYAKQNHVDHTVNDQTSILRFIEDNWGLPGIGDQSFDALANSILGHFDFTKVHEGVVLLNPSSGEVAAKAHN